MLTEWAELQTQLDASDNIVYMGKHVTYGAADTDVGWYIWKFYWDANGNFLKKRGPVIGKWTDRTTLI